MIARIAASPSAGAARRRPGMTIAENAKNTPAMSPQPTAAMIVKVNMNDSQVDVGETFHRLSARIHVRPSTLGGWTH
nr:hypothetical protein GCM10017745_79680 [Saccharothrix mutabilis subsp. capreolus]